MAKREVHPVSRRPFLPVLFLAALLVPSSTKGGTEERAAQVLAAVRPRAAGGRSLLLRVDGAGLVIERIGLELPKKEIAAKAAAGLLPSGWKVVRKRARLELSGPPAAAPVFLRFDIVEAPDFDHVEVEVSAAGRVVHSREPVRKTGAVEPVRTAADLLLLPPLLTPGETIEMNVQKPGYAAGRWSLAGEQAVATGAGAGGQPVLRVRVAADAGPAGPFALTYVEPWGETVVQASALDLSRLVPAGLAPPDRPRLAPCGLGAANPWVTCLCGWFPDAPSRAGILVDDRPAPPPVAASQRSICLRLAPGAHVLAGAEAAGFDPANRQEVVALLVDRSIQGKVLVGQSATLSWRVTGSERPVRLRLRNASPGVATLAGGDLQFALTSGGSPNQVARTITGVTSGSSHVLAEIAEPLSAATGQEYPQMIAAVFPRELRRIAARLRAAALELPAAAAGTPPLPTVSREDLLALLDATATEIRNSLPYPELAAFRDAATARLGEIRREIESLPAVARRPARGDVALAAGRPSPPNRSAHGAGPRIDKTRSDSLIAKVIDFLERSAAEPALRTVCIVTMPEAGAVVKLFPPSLPSDQKEVTSNSRLTLYLGLYAYETTRQGYARGEGRVDLQLNAEPVVEFPLAKQPGAPQAPRHLAEPLERCP
jgi:hypothetical protein